MLIITGVPRRAMVAVDQMSVRSVADSARILGKAFGKNETAWSSTARHMQIGMNDLSQEMSHTEIINFVQRHQAALDFAFELLANNKRGLCSAPLRAVIARAYYRIRSRNRIRLFCEYLLSGLVGNVETDAAVIKLRNWLLDVQSRGHSGGKRIREQTYAKTEEALVLFLNEAECDRLAQAKEEMFPLPEESADE